jgi:hypothetical protein
MAMRHRKRAPALFEVIRSTGGGTAAVVVEDRRPLFRFPRLSFGRRLTSPGFGVVDAAPPVAEFAQSDAYDIRPSLADPTLGRGSMVSPSAVHRRRSSGVHFGYDADRQEVTLRMRYTTAVISAFSFVVLIGLAYVTGRHGAFAPGPLAAVSTEMLKKGPAQPSVLEVGRSGGEAGNRGAITSGNGVSPAFTPERPKVANGKASASQPQPQPASAKMPANISTAPTGQTNGAIVEDNARRAAGLNYVIVQSYPDQKSAGEAAAFLNKAGVHCTVEPAPPGFVNNPSWVSVVGTAGFQRIRNSPDYDNYVKGIQKLGEQYAGTSKFKRFQPQPYRWRGTPAGA